MNQSSEAFHKRQIMTEHDRQSSDSIMHADLPFTMMKEPIVQVKKQSGDMGHISIISSSSVPKKAVRGTPQEFVVKTAIITGENKWREEVQKHKDRLHEARTFQQRVV